MEIKEESWKMMEKRKGYVPKWSTYVMRPQNTAYNSTETLRSRNKNIIKMIKKIKKKSKNKKKGKYHSDEIDNPNLSQALLSKNADDGTRAINAEMKQMKVENVYEAVTQLPYGKPWVASHMILIRQRFADGKIKKYKARLVAGGHR